MRKATVPPQCHSATPRATKLRHHVIDYPIAVEPLQAELLSRIPGIQADEADIIIGFTTFLVDLVKMLSSPSFLGRGERLLHSCRRPHAATACV